MKRFTKAENGWMLYDWANSAYSLIVYTAIFPIFYKAEATAAGVSSVQSTAYLGYTIAISTFLLAMLSPILGTIADYDGMKMRFFTFFFVVGIVSTGMLAFIPEGQWMLLLIVYTISALGFAGSNIFYDAFLVDVTDEKRMDTVSAQGFGIGYIGSTIPFILSIAIIMLAQKDIIPLAAGTASKVSFFITALWWGIFTIPMFRHVRQMYSIPRESNPIAKSFRRLGKTFREARAYKPLFLFLLAYFFYIDGVGTIIKMSTAYGTDLGIDATTLLIILFVTQLVAAPFAILYGKLSQRFTGKKMLYAGIVVYIGVCIYAMFMKTAVDFWILAMLVATSQGGIQALSRSYFAKLIPKENANEFFGFYNIFGKFAAVMGPLLLASTAQWTESTSAGVFSLIILFVIGIVILARVPEPEKGEMQGSVQKTS